MTSAQMPPAALPAPTMDGKLVARLILVALGACGAILVSLVFGCIWVFTNDHLSGAEMAGIIASATLSLFLPVILFGISSSWMFSVTHEGRKSLVRWVWGTTAVQAVSVAVLIALGFVTHPPIWVPITLVTCAVVFAAVGILLAPLLRSTPRTTEPVPLIGWTPVAERRPLVPIIAAALFIVIAALGTLLIRPWAAGQLGPRGAHLLLSGEFLALEFAFLASAVTCIVGLLLRQGELRGIVSRDWSQARRIRRAIARPQATAQLLEVDEERARATAWATAMMLRWQAAFTALLFASLIAGQISTGLTSGWIIGAWLPVGMGVVGVVLVVFLLIRASAAQRYFEVHTS